VYVQHTDDPSTTGTTEASVRRKGTSGTAVEDAQLRVRFKKDDNGTGQRNGSTVVGFVNTDSSGVVQYRVDSASVANGTPQMTVFVNAYRMLL
jgi:hypothetical protein